MPLPSTCPMEFASMPEHFLEDAMELLIFASRIPRALDGVFLVDFKFISFILNLCPLLSPESLPTHIHAIYFGWQDDFMNFIIMFMASPEFIRNPYLRAKMVEVLNCWMPRRR